MTNPARRRGLSPRAVRRRVRAGLRTASAAIGLLLLLAPALPAAAATTSDIGQIGDVRSPDGLSVPLMLLLYVGVPLAGFVIGGALAFRPPRGVRRRYRPGRPWTYEPVWFGDESSLEHEPKRAALPGAGGASGRW